MSQESHPVGARRHPVVRLLGSISFGITLLVLILAYASIGSALAPVRGALEMTEMQVFDHWLFVLLIALFSLSLVVASVTRIRWNRINAGALTVHTGLLLLVGGAVWYFHSKVEGDVLLTSPRVELLTADGRALPGAALVARPGASWEQHMPAFGGPVRLEVQEVQPADGPIAQAVVQASFGSAAPQPVTVPANGLAPTPLGNGLGLRLRTFPAQSRFYDKDVAALYYRNLREPAAKYVELPGLPLHRERYLPGEGELRDTGGQPVPSKRTSPCLALGPLRVPTGWLEHWRLPIRVDAPGLPFAVEVTGYVPYMAGSESVVRGDGPRENPVLEFRLESGGQSIEPILAAFEPGRAKLGLSVPIEFRWLRSPAELETALGATVEASQVLVLAGPETAPLLGILQPGVPARRLPLEPGRRTALGLPEFPVDFTLLRLERMGRWLSQPTIQPLALRRPGMDRDVSAIRLKLTGLGAYAGWSETRWVPFSRYPQVDPSTGPPELSARPLNVSGPDGQTYEFTYSRPPRDLEATLVPGRLIVKFFPGRRAAESWRSEFWTQSAGAAALTPAAVYTNQTHTVGPWTLFQSGAAGDHWSWTILGVGNRRGMWPMGLGCILITIGCLYAFYVKPVLRRRAAMAQAARSAADVPALEPSVAMASDNGAGRLRPDGARAGKRIGALALLLCCGVAARAAEPLAASSRAVELDRQLNWHQAALIVVQDANRYKTLEAFARENVGAMYGRHHLPGLSPLASLCELLFNHDAYLDAPIIRIRDAGLRIHLSESLPDAARARIRAESQDAPRQTLGYMTIRELADPAVQKRMDELEPRFEMITAMRRVRNAEATALFLDRLLRIVPRPGETADALWYTPLEIRANAALALPEGQRPTLEEIAQRYGMPAAGVSPAQAVSVFGAWLELENAWQAYDAPRVQAALDRLASVLPTLNPAVYPPERQRLAEASYYDNFVAQSSLQKSIFSRASLGWLLYLLGALVGVLALVTRWRGPWAVALLLLLAALSVHAYGLGLRWYILGRIPVANMFEAVVASAWVGIALALVLELVYRTRVFLVAAHVTGFFALVVAGYVLPGGGNITSVMGILDDIMLRIHTVMIIASYALIFLAAVIAAVYLFGYYFHTSAVRSAQTGLMAALAGGLLWTVALTLANDTTGHAGGAVTAKYVAVAALGAGIATAIALAVLTWLRAPGLVLAGLTLLLGALLSLGTAPAGFSRALGLLLLCGGLGWSVLNGFGMMLRRRGPAMAPAARDLARTGTLAGPQPGLALATAGPGAAAGALRWQRPVLAGGAPGDERASAGLPAWLHNMDWSHLIILNMAFIILFGGVILGAVWADYSWGRPWGWDPKETFAMNTWLIYAVLIHARFIVQRKGLWTAWLSVLGCAMMAFNWFVVNFYIVGLHSYA